MNRKMYDLTAPQKSIWLTEQYFTNSNINNICGTAIVSKLLDFDLLKKAINNVIEMNDIFNLHFIEDNGNLKQYFEKLESKPIEIIELDSKDDISALEQKLLSKVYNINEDLYDFKIFRVNNAEICGYMLNIHHIKSDAFTLGLCCKKIMQEYIALSTNQPSEKNEKATYENYINSEFEYLNSKKYENDKNYWEEKFKEIPNIVTIPSNKKDSTEFSFLANRYNFLVDKEKMNKITEFCANSKISVFNLFMGVLSIYMYRVNNINDFVIGTPILNRTNFVEKNTLGMFINVAPLRVNINNNSTIQELLCDIATDSMGLLRHQKYSYQSILENIRKINPSIPNLYNIVLSYQITKANLESDINYETRWAFNGTCSDDIDIHLFDLDNSGELNIAYDYKIDKYDEQDIIDINKRLNYLIDQVLENSTLKIQDLEIATPEERELILNEFNDTNIDYPFNKNIIQLFEDQVQLHPNNLAVVFENEKLTYKSLNEKVTKLANYLYSQKITYSTKNNNKTPIIAVYLNKSINYIVSILAILKAGYTFMPISTTYPKDRIQHMLKDSESSLLISSETYIHNIKTSLKTIDIEQINLEETQNYAMPLQTIDNIAYIIYTSGSTGLPKAVGVSQKSLINHIVGIQNRFENSISHNDIALSIANISFDANIQEIFIPLLCGSTLHLLEDNSIYDTIKLANYIYENKITFTFIPPTLLDILYEELCKYNKLYINKMLVGVQSIYNTTLNNYFNLNPNMKIHNGYGPTEATICCISCMYNEKNDNQKFILPIGKPMKNCKAFILDSNGKIQPPLVMGEICIGGECVSKGYIKLPKKTQEKFTIVKSLNNTYIYKTGDLGYFDRTGTIHFIGRKDNQIKLHGFRIELEEINTVISKNSKIKASYTLLYKENQISSFIVPKEPLNFDMNRLKLYLQKKLPYYMIPTNIISIQKLPINKNGKVDYSNLMDMIDSLDSTDSKEFLSSETETDKKIENILKELLNLKTINFNNNIFELGGDSLIAIKLCSAIKHTFNIEITVKNIFEIKNIKELSNYIEKNSNTSKEFESILNSATLDHYSISSAQKRIYYTSNMSNSNLGVYNISGGIEFYNTIDLDKIQKIFNVIISRHESFRTYFIIDNGEIIQKITPHANFNIEFVNTSPEDIDNQFKKFNTNFDLSIPPLLKVKILYLTNGHTMLLVNMHHIISDGTSMQILLDEFCKLYNNEELPKIKFTYKDFINYEQYFSGSTQYHQNKTFWLNEFKDEVPTLNFPTTFSRPSTFTYKGAKIYNTIDKTLTNSILNASKNLKVTPYMFLLAAYYILLYKYTGQENIIVGTPIANRDIPEFSNIIGMFVNTIPIRKEISSSKTFSTFLEEVREKCLNCFTHQNYPFEELVKELNIPRDVSRNPLIDVMFIYQNTGMNTLKIDNTETKYYTPDTNISKFDFSLEIIPQLETFQLNLEYCTDLFSKEFITNFSLHYIELLKHIISNINCPISDLEILSFEEKNKILCNFNNTKRYYDENEFIYKLIDKQCIKTPNYTAVTFQDKTLTYKELLEKSNSLANYLHHIGVQRNTTVGIMLPRCLELLVAILATLKAGACYVPIDPTFPESRIEYMLSNSNSSLLLTFDNLRKPNIKNVCVEFSNTSLYSNPILNFEYNNQSIDPFYMIYTSGSTGTPKGVVLSHKNVSNLTNFMNNYVEYFKTDYGNMAIASLTTISFDIFISETLMSLQRGLNIILSTENEQTMPDQLNKLIEKNNVKVFQLTPSRMDILLNNINLLPALKNIKFILLCGETLPNKLLQSVLNLGVERVYNGYGPSETTIFSTLTDVTNAEFVNLGKPVDNTQIYIYDKDNNVCPIGVPGEICICGDGVGLGYRNIAPTVKNNFTIHPISKRPMYRSGDLAKYLPTGDIMYVERIDNQVKIRGLRIELDEIENKILEFPNVKKAVVLARTDTNNRKYIVSYLTVKDRISINKLREYLRKYLPKYMIPSYFEILDEFPYLASGKVNKKILPPPTLQANTQDFIPARNNLDKKILHIFETLLNLSPIGITDNFFELGGDSLLAIKLQIELMKFTNEITYADIFLNPTVQELTDKIQNMHNIVESLTDTVDLLNYNTYVQDYTKLPTSLEKTEVRNILLTGATGYLGVHVLNEFIKYETGNIYCLIRPEKGLTLEQKLLNKLHFYFDNSLDHFVNKRIFIINGDITLPNLGLSKNDYNELTSNVSTIINCAAKVSHFGKYELYQKINVVGVQNLIDFCKQNSKTLYHISTTSICGDRLNPDNNLNIATNIYKENNFFIEQIIENVYVKSKFEAEKLIISELQNGLNAYILRIGNLMGRNSDGKFQQNIEENAYVNRLLSFIRIKHVPEAFLEHTLEFTPVDYCSTAIVKLVSHRNNTNRIFHLLNNNRILIKDLLNIFEKIYFRIEPVSSAEFKFLIDSILKSNTHSDYLNGLISDFDNHGKLDYEQKIEVSSIFSNNYLKLVNFEWPNIDEKYITNFFKYLNNLYKFKEEK
ncbi:MAG: amino acid adenylation domain-containing protein [Clostridia bacterium]|nr:amino acid adenylation domain-containing protein [Clostridia bacterium]